MQVAISIIIVIALRLILMPKSSVIIFAIKGVAKVKVVAVPASRANTASKSIILPRKPS